MKGKLMLNFEDLISNITRCLPLSRKRATPTPPYDLKIALSY
ncbi:hypothetical protein [uncultured Dokdonia sp.]|nr:hypothetical protein [uncultured Dokdonia sp.]